MDLDSFIETLLKTEKPKKYPYSIYYTEGVKYLNLGLHQTALPYLDHAIETNKTSVKCLLKRAKCFLGLRQYDAAIEDAEQALQLSAGNSEAIDLKGQAQYMKGDFEGGYLTYLNARRKNLKDNRYRLGKQLCKEAMENTFKAKQKPSLGKEDVVGVKTPTKDDKAFDKKLEVLRSRRDLFVKDKKFMEELLKDKDLSAVHRFCREAIAYISDCERLWTMEAPLNTRASPPHTSSKRTVKEKQKTD